MGRAVEGMNSNIINLIYCKNFCKCHNVSPSSTTMKNEKEKKIKTMKIKESADIPPHPRKL
jgi:hypothetical protein